jgi:ABC-2 type transport system permease protein
MTTVAALGFFLSQFAENSIGPIVATMSIIVFLTILSTMSIPLLIQ